MPSISEVIKFTIRILVFCLLTTLTQIGGVVYLFSILIYVRIENYTSKKLLKTFHKITIFLFLYFITTFFITPFFAKRLGREPLPLLETNHVKPLNALTCLLNRNYVRKELRDVTFDVANKMNTEFPGTTVNYLDANFPFINGFPLFPHLSHNDGKKLDISFCYLDRKTGKPTNNSPSLFGYGICEEPLPNEINTSKLCVKNWKYSIIRNIMPQGNKKNFIFFSYKTSKLVEYFAMQPTIKKIFIEPHLKTRLKLNSNKIRFHGCKAVRHDDHLHVQIK